MLHTILLLHAAVKKKIEFIMRELIMLFSCFSRGVDWNGSQNYVKTIWLVKSMFDLLLRPAPFPQLSEKSDKSESGRAGPSSP